MAKTDLCRRPGCSFKRPGLVVLTWDQTQVGIPMDTLVPVLRHRSSKAGSAAEPESGSADAVYGVAEPESTATGSTATAGAAAAIAAPDTPHPSEIATAAITLTLRRRMSSTSRATNRHRNGSAARQK